MRNHRTTDEYPCQYCGCLFRPLAHSRRRFCSQDCKNSHQLGAPRGGIDPVARFWSYVDKTGDCWLWTGSTTEDGYGNVLWEGATRRAHRVSYELTYGEIPEGASILHKCDTPRCVRPEHLRPGTQFDNMQDMMSKGRAKLPGKRGEAHYAAKLTEDDVREIRHLADEGIGSTAIGKLFRISQAQASGIIHRTKWRHIE